MAFLHVRGKAKKPVAFSRQVEPTKRIPMLTLEYVIMIPFALVFLASLHVVLSICPMCLCARFWKSMSLWYRPVVLRS